MASGRRWKGIVRRGTEGQRLELHTHAESPELLRLRCHNQRPSPLQPDESSPYPESPNMSDSEAGGILSDGAQNVASDDSAILPDPAPAVLERPPRRCKPFRALGPLVMYAVVASTGSEALWRDTFLRPSGHAFLRDALANAGSDGTSVDLNPVADGASRLLGVVCAHAYQFLTRAEGDNAADVQFDFFRRALLSGQQHSAVLGYVSYPVLAAAHMSEPMELSMGESGAQTTQKLQNANLHIGSATLDMGALRRTWAQRLTMPLHAPIHVVRLWSPLAWAIVLGAWSTLSMLCVNKRTHRKKLLAPGCPT
eukprot:5434330-Lingulodinium_polyedra.AAC.1